MTTVHADTPTRALDQLAMLALQSGARIEPITRSVASPCIREEDDRHAPPTASPISFIIGISVETAPVASASRSKRI